MVKFSVSGLRGVVGVYFSSLDFMKVANAYVRFMKANNLLLARDARITGVMLHSAVKSAVLAAGSGVSDAGMVTTPTAVFATKAVSADAGLVITASHNPSNQNGIKFLESGRFLVPARSKEFIDSEKSAGFYQVEAGEIQQVKDFDASSVHTEGILRLLAKEPQEPRLRVGLDPCNGAAGPQARRILEDLNCEVHAINAEPNGRFGRDPEPLEQNLKDLQSLVKQSKLDLGFAFDPDGDRLSFVDGKGRTPGEEYTVPLCARWVLQKKGGDVVVNLSTSRLIEHITQEAGYEVHRTPVGEAHVVDRLLELGASCGGEGNGGFIMPEFNATRDGLLAMAVLVIQYRRLGPIEDQVDQLPTYHRRRAKFDIPWSEELVQRIVGLYPSAGTGNQDGIWLGEEDFWLHLRPSNTEPVIRLMLEADTASRADNILREVQNICVG
ncbi:hypothetical protein JXM67_10110 [candidate division WOR-3 bacterium]|nr:hypothetical protein [candidate division WOR-3 bacterium]